MTPVMVPLVVIMKLAGGDVAKVSAVIPFVLNAIPVSPLTPFRVTVCVFEEGS